MNMVDVDTHELLAAWLLTATVSTPAVLRDYDVAIAYGKGAYKVSCTERRKSRQ
jgi:hypothetical protein